MRWNEMARDKSRLYEMKWDEIIYKMNDAQWD